MVISMIARSAQRDAAISLFKVTINPQTDSKPDRPQHPALACCGGTRIGWGHPAQMQGMPKRSNLNHEIASSGLTTFLTNILDSGGISAAVFKTKIDSRGGLCRSDLVLVRGRVVGQMRSSRMFIDSSDAPAAVERFCHPERQRRIPPM